MTFWRSRTSEKLDKILASINNRHDDERIEIILRGVLTILTKENMIMGKLDDVKAKVDALADSQASEHDQISMVIDLIKQLRDDPTDADAAAAVDAALAAFDDAKAKADSDREALKAAADSAAASGDVT